MRNGDGLRVSQGGEDKRKSRKQASPASPAPDTVLKDPHLTPGPWGPPGFERGCGRA